MQIKNLLIFLAVLPLSVFSQEVLLEETVTEDTAEVTFGPNHTHFLHQYFGVGAAVGEVEGTGVEVNHIKSLDVYYGGRYKYKVSEIFSLGSEFQYRHEQFRLQQDSGKFFPDSALHDKQKLRFNHLEYGIYSRMNFQKRGNTMGKFLDVGAYGGWTFRLVELSKDELDNGTKVKQVLSGLDYYNRWNYGVMARLGFGRFVITGNYRLSDLFQGKFNHPEMPRWKVGLQIGFH